VSHTVRRQCCLQSAQEEPQISHQIACFQALFSYPVSTVLVMGNEDQK
jgi:hypothetical protein